MTEYEIKSIVDSYSEKLISYRNRLHENPELSFQEVETSKFIKEKLTSFGIRIREGITDYSVLGELDSGSDGPSILFRADMDALPVQEAVDWAHKSKKDNVMHACGHDVHTAILLSFAELLSDHPELLTRGKVLFAFQAAEESLPGGAQQMIRDGAVNDVDYVFALHTGMAETGEIGICPGIASAAVGNYSIKVTGKGGHSGFPHAAKDPIAALCDIAVALQRLTARKIDPIHTTVLTVGCINAGTAPNIIPESGTLNGCIRCGYTEDRDTLFHEVNRIATSICDAYDCACEVELESGYPSMHNDPASLDVVRSAAERCGICVKEKPMQMGAEDFSYFLEERPGAFFALGVRDPERPETAFPNHSPKFFPDETAFINGLRMFTEILLTLTNR